MCYFPTKINFTNNNFIPLGTERGRDATAFRDQTIPKTPNRSRERDPDKPAQNKEKRKRRGSLSPPSSAYERGTKRPDDR